MKEIVKKGMHALLLVPALALTLSVVAPVVGTAAAECDDVGADSGLNVSNGANCAQGDNTSSDLFGSDGVFKTITNVLLFIIGAISVIMLIIGGIRYTVSGGDSGAVTGAKNTILYAIVGIVVSLLAFAIVNFVLGQFAPDSTT